MIREALRYVMAPGGFLACSVALGMVVASPVLAEGIEGYWLKTSTDGGDAVIEIYPNGDGGFDGRIVRLEYPRHKSGEIKRDSRNPDPGQRSRPIEGLEIIEGFKPDGQAEWAGATIYNPEDGKTYKCSAKLAEDGTTLHVRGYIGFSLFGKTQTWARVESPAILERKAAHAE